MKRALGQLYLNVADTLYGLAVYKHAEHIFFILQGDALVCILPMPVITKNGQVGY